MSPALAGRFYTTSATWEAQVQHGVPTLNIHSLIFYEVYLCEIEIPIKIYVSITLKSSLPVSPCPQLIPKGKTVLIFFQGRFCSVQEFQINGIILSLSFDVDLCHHVFCLYLLACSILKRTRI